MTQAAQILLPYLFRLDRYEASQFITMTRQWKRVSGDLYKRADELAKSDFISPTDLLEFRVQMDRVALEYSIFNKALITKGQQQFGEQGLKSARQMLNLADRPYRQLSPDAIERRAGRTRNFQPLDRLLQAKYRDREERAEKVLVSRDSNTPLLVAAALTGILFVSISTARQEQMEVFRDIQTSAFVESRIATMKNWVGEPDACAAICQPGIEGSPYPMDYVMDTHPNCRCAFEPIFDDA